MKSLLRPIVIFLTLCLAGPAQAGQTEWYDTEGGKVRIVAKAADDAGIVRAALEVALKPGWKTYWRDPGSSGIPPYVTASGSRNLQFVSLLYPAPTLLEDSYASYAGYDQPVAFPLIFRQRSPGRDSHLRAQVFLGICEQICIPVQTEFELTVAGVAQGSDFSAAKVDLAFSNLPDAPGTEFNLVDLSVDGGAVTFVVKAPGLPNQTELFFTGPQGWYFGRAVQKTFDEDRITFVSRLIEGPAGQSLSGQDLDIVVRSGHQSITLIETVR